MQKDVWKMGKWENEIKKVKNKSDARQLAIEWQKWASEKSLSYGELHYFSEMFYKLGKRYGLVREFKENGIV